MNLVTSDLLIGLVLVLLLDDAFALRKADRRRRRTRVGTRNELNIPPLEPMPNSGFPAGLESISDDDTTGVDLPISEPRDDVNLFANDAFTMRGDHRRRADRVPPDTRRDSSTKWISWKDSYHFGNPSDPLWKVKSISPLRFLGHENAGTIGGRCTGPDEIIIYGNKWGAKWTPGVKHSGRKCTNRDFGRNPNYGNHRGCWCGTQTCEQGYAFNSNGFCYLVTVEGRWKQLVNVASTEKNDFQYTAHYGLTLNHSSYEASAVFKASMKTKSSGFSFFGIFAGSSSTKVNAQFHYRVEFRNYSYTENHTYNGFYIRSNGKYLYQFQYSVKVDGAVVSIAKDHVLVQANTTPRCLPTKNRNDDYSKCQ